MPNKVKYKKKKRYSDSKYFLLNILFLHHAINLLFFYTACLMIVSILSNHFTYQYPSLSGIVFGPQLYTCGQNMTVTFIIVDYISATLMHWDYFIGATFDTSIMDWKWVNGSTVDSGFLMNYPVAGSGSDDCLIWSDVAYLVDFPCSLSNPFICEIQISP